MGLLTFSVNVTLDGCIDHQEGSPTTRRMPYELKSYDREPNMAAPPNYKSLTQFGTSPVIQDDGLTLGESGAIVEYIPTRIPGLVS